MYYVYVLENGQGRHYIGSCSNLENRLRKHNQNSVRSTKNKGPFEIVLKEEFAHKTQARKRELQIKSFKGNYRFTELLSPSSSLA